MKILLVGGGTAGSVSPLLAVAEKILEKHTKAEFLFVGGKTGPERQMAESANVKFLEVSSGKLRRYFSWQNFVSPIFVLIGFFQSLKILKKFKPQVVFGAGSFVQVPVVWAAKYLKIPVVLHQQDLQPSLANTLCQITATKITVTFEDSLLDFASGIGLFRKSQPDKLVWTGNPFREKLKNFTKEDGLKYFKLKNSLPVLLVLGGGTGSEFINQLIWEALPQLTKTVQVVHATGNGKLEKHNFENYHAFEFISEMGPAYAAADIVLCRAGLSTITELSNLGKVSIVVPMPESHQEINAELLARYRASLTVSQKNLNPEVLITVVRKLLFEHQLQKDLIYNINKIMPKNSVEKISEIIIKLISK